MERSWRTFYCSRWLNRVWISQYKRLWWWLSSMWILEKIRVSYLHWLWRIESHLNWWMTLFHILISWKIRKVSLLTIYLLYVKSHSKFVMISIPVHIASMRISLCHSRTVLEEDATVPSILMAIKSEQEEMCLKKF